MASSKSIYILSTPPTTGTKACNLAVSMSLISKFYIPLNESKRTLPGIETVTNLIKVVKRHPDKNPAKLKVDLFLDASCFGHLLRPSIAIKNHVFNNVVNNIRNNDSIIMRLLPETIIRYGWARGDSNPADLTSKIFLTPTKIINKLRLSWAKLSKTGAEHGFLVG